MHINNKNILTYTYLIRYFNVCRCRLHMFSVDTDAGLLLLLSVCLYTDMIMIVFNDQNYKQSQCGVKAAQTSLEL